MGGKNKASKKKHTHTENGLPTYRSHLSVPKTKHNMTSCSLARQIAFSLCNYLLPICVTVVVLLLITVLQLGMLCFVLGTDR